MLRKCLISILTFWCLNITAQAGDTSILEARISIAFSNVNLNAALRQLNRQANVRFSYNSDIIPRVEKIISSYRQETLRQILDDLLENTNLGYEERNGNIVINKRVLSRRSLKGIVVDGVSGAPLPYASVFIDNSVLGVPTETDGTFELANLPDRAFDLVTSYVSYDSKMFSIRMDTVSNDELLRIEIFESAKQLDNVIVTPLTRKEKRLDKRLLRKFEAEFLGRSDNSKKCRILNPHVLEVKRIDGSNHFVVTADEEVIIENRALGYRIKYQLNEFIFDDGAQTTTGIARFEELAAKSRKQNRIWEEARRQAYYGSLPHFLNSLIEDDISAQGFEVNIVQFDSVTSEYITIHNPPEVDEILKLEKGGNEDRYEMTANADIEITYTKEAEDQDYVKQFRTRSKSGNYKYTDIKSRSRIAAGNQILQVIIDADEMLYQKSVILFKNRNPQIKFPGIFSNDKDALYLGYWNWGGISEKLPLYFKPRY